MGEGVQNGGQNPKGYMLYVTFGLVCNLCEVVVFIGFLGQKLHRLHRLHIKTRLYYIL